jgi:hypothetical protein
VNSPKNLAQTKRNSGRILSRSSDLFKWMPKVSNVSGRLLSTSPTVYF